MKILAKEKLSEHKYKTPEGYLICVDSVLARTGKQTYTRDELFHDGDETEIEVDRTPEEVFSDATLASFENKPLVVEHPDEDVNSSNIQQYAVGFVRDVKRGELDGEPVMLGTLVITVEQTIKEIEDGEHTDLSCGYDCDIQDEAEPSQKNIRGNHVALCETGRAGIARIVDSVKDVDNKVAKIRIEFDRHQKLWCACPLNANGDVIGDYEYAGSKQEAELAAKKWKVGEKTTEIYDAVEPTANTSYKGYDITAASTGYKNTPTEVNIIDPSTKKKFKSYFTAETDLNKALREARDYYMKEVPLSKKNEEFIGNYLNMMSGFTRRKDADIQDFIRPLQGKGYKPIVEKVEGWIWKKGSYAYKNYYMSLDGYTNKFIITIYADPDNEWETKEFNAYFNDSIKDSKFEEYMRKLAYIEEYWQVSKLLERAYNELGLDEYKRLREAGEKRKKEILAMHDSTNDALTEKEIRYAFDQFKKRIKVKDPEEFKFVRELAEKKGYAAAYDDHNGYAHIYYDSIDDSDTDVEDSFNDVPNWFKSLMLEAKNKIGLRSIGAIVTYIKQNSKIDEDTAREWYMQCYSKLGLPAWEKEAWRDEKVEDAMEKYYIRWIDQYSKSKGYDKSFWLYDDEVKANSAKEALDKLANIAVMRGVGTRYVTIVNIKTDKTSYQVSGNIDDLRKRQLDSMASTYEKATKGLKEQLNNVGDSCKVGKYKVTKIK